MTAAALLAAPASAAQTGASTGHDLGEARPPSTVLAAEGVFYNPEAVIPPQCYTKIEGKFNPCYVCHQTYEDDDRPNYMKDGDLQRAYNFSEAALTNHWTNLFVDRTEEIAGISDADILAYVDDENYTDLAPRLRDRDWAGYVPDLTDYHLGAAAFDAQGFAKDSSGWVAFTYKPQPSTFWPTNGSTDDVVLRLPEAFRRAADGTPSRDVYMANLALLEMAFQDLDSTTVPPIDESAVGLDLDGDGFQGLTERVLRRDGYVGAAAGTPLSRMLYPENTEFLHSVRYVGVADGEIGTPPRMKELRYMRKTAFLSPPMLRSLYGNEKQEKEDGNLPRRVWLGDAGLDTGMGWLVAGFIEDASGDLRPQTTEETFFCKGCHATAGASLDQTWAFPRKVAGAAGWGYLDTHGMPDAPAKGQEVNEIEQYLSRSGGGDEFRSNTEMSERWFDGDRVDRAAVRAADVKALISPTPDRALALDKAYRQIVREQSFVFGRDATVTPPGNVHRSIDSATASTLPPDLRFDHDIRLDW